MILRRGFRPRGELAGTVPARCARASPARPSLQPRMTARARGRRLPARLIGGALAALLTGASGEVVRVADAETIAPIVEAWLAATPSGDDSLARRVARGRFPTDAVREFVAGRADVAVVARELFASESAAARAARPGGAVLVPVATGTRATRGGTHAIAIFVHDRNPLARLSLTALAEVLAADGQARTWGDLGVEGPLAARPITVHGMLVRRESGDPPGVVNFLEQRVLRGRPWRGDLVEHRDEPGGAQALAAIVAAVAADEAAIGYSGFDYAVPGAKAVALAETARGPHFAGSEREVADRVYPLARTVYLCLPAAPTEAVLAWARRALGEAGQRAIAASGTGFSPLPPAALAEARTRLPLVPPSTATYRDDTGAIRVAGYNDMDEMVGAWCAAFSERHPAFRFSIDLRATRAGPPALAAGMAAFIPLGAELAPEQRHEFARAGRAAPAVFRVAHASLDARALSGPLAIVVHRDNPLAALSLTELASIFAGEPVGGALHAYGLDPDTALGRFFVERVMQGRPFGPGFTGFRQSAEVVERVGRDPAGIGFAAAVRITPDVRLVALSAAPGLPPVLPTGPALRAGVYPLDRFLLLAFNRPMEPWMREFMRLVLSESGQRRIEEGTRGYLPLSAVERDEERAALAREFPPDL